MASPLLHRYQDTPTLTTERLILRPWTIEDAPALASIANNWNVTAYMRDRFPHPYSLQDAQFFISKVAMADGDASFAACLKPSDGSPGAGTVPIGGVTLMNRQDVYRQTKELGYWLGEEHWGKGYATEMAQRIVRWAFGERTEWMDGEESEGKAGVGEGLEKIEAGRFSSNEGSGKVLLKCGFTEEGRLRRAVKKRGVFLDAILYGLLRDEWEVLGMK